MKPVQVVLAFLAILLAGCGQAGGNCPVTPPPDEVFVPPAAFPAVAPEGLFYIGTPALWTALPVEGYWESLPQDEHGYTNKIVFWSESYNVEREPVPALTVSGRRLDGDSPPLDAPTATNGYSADSGQFMLTGVNIPTTGCWEISGAYNGETLTYVIEVKP